MNISEHIIDYFKKDEVILFIGAGASVNAGLPSWAQLIKPLAKDVGFHWPETESNLVAEHLLSVAQYYENSFGRHSLIRYLRTQLDTTRLDPSAIHLLIALLPSRIVFTTNYDDLLERTFQQLNKQVNLIVSELELPYWNERQIQLIKVCGDLSRPDSLIVTKRDFSMYFETHRRLVERLRTILESKTALFLGYGLKDPFFNQIWDSITATMQNHQRPGYAVQFDADALDIQDAWLRGINIINLSTDGKPRESVLSDWLKNLIDNVSSDAVS